MSANGAITVSEDRLRAVMAEFELRLTDTIRELLVGKADVAVVATIAATQLEHDKRLDTLEDWRKENEAVQVSRKSLFAGVIGILGASWAIPDIAHKLLH